jgi:hypothetical protein
LPNCAVITIKAARIARRKPTPAPGLCLRAPPGARRPGMCSEVTRHAYGDQVVICMARLSSASLLSRRAFTGRLFDARPANPLPGRSQPTDRPWYREGDSCIYWMQGTVAFVTLIMVLVNNDQAILLADRRISEKQTITLPDGLTREAHKPLNDEYNKLTVFTCRNARVGIGFTGVATKLTGFSTAKWLLEALMEAARPSPFLEPTVDRLRQIATRDIGALPGDKQLTIVLAGYTYDSEAQPLGCLYSISNFEDSATKRRYPTQSEFKS